MKQLGEVTLRGLPISKGIGIGSPLYFHSAERGGSTELLTGEEVDQEIHRYRKALDLSCQDIEDLRKISLSEGPEEIVSILGTHLEMMRDPLMTTQIEEKIRTTQQRSETIFSALLEEYTERFRTIQDSFFKERVRDVVDISRRILGHLNPGTATRMTAVAKRSVIFTQELVPSETVEADPEKVCGFVTMADGITSHAAIIARAKGIPCVTGITALCFEEVKEVRSIIVDGSQGLVILNPTKQTLKKYLLLKKGLLETDKKLKNVLPYQGETIDGYEVQVFANLENPHEMDLLRKNGAAGVGLFRSEYLCLSRHRFPTEEEQFFAYQKMARALKGKPLVIRIFDIGGDKNIDPLPEKEGEYDFAELRGEANPALGCRAIRFLLRYSDILKTQLRAILRASRYGDVQILIPMVSDLQEIEKIKVWVEKVRKELISEGHKIPEKIPLGCMIEVPSAALLAGQIAEHVDFLSIGTNDLTQYVLAADRNNPNTSELYFSPHPSLLQLIQKIIESVAKLSKPILLCGEYAADPMLIPILIGLGIRELSVSARHIPLVKHTLKKWTILEASRVAAGALEQTSAGALKQYLLQEAMR